MADTADANATPTDDSSSDEADNESAVNDSLPTGGELVTQDDQDTTDESSTEVEQLKTLDESSDCSLQTESTNNKLNQAALSPSSLYETGQRNNTANKELNISDLSSDSSNETGRRNNNANKELNPQDLSPGSSKGAGRRNNNANNVQFTAASCNLSSEVGSSSLLLRRGESNTAESSDEPPQPVELGAVNGCGSAPHTPPCSAGEGSSTPRIPLVKYVLALFNLFSHSVAHEQHFVSSQTL